MTVRELRKQLLDMFDQNSQVAIGNLLKVRKTGLDYKIFKFTGSIGTDGEIVIICFDKKDKGRLTSSK